MSRRALSILLATAATAGPVLGGGCAGADEGPRATPTRPSRPTAIPRKPPVVLLILDELPTDSLVGPDRRIDAARYPSFAALAATSTWYPNATTIYDSTPKAVPAILDARMPFEGQAPDTRDHRRSIYTLLGRRGYGIVDSEEATAICPRRYCRGARKRRPAIIPNLNRGRRERLDRWIRSIRPRRRPYLYVKHALLPHGPWIYLPSGRQVRPSVSDPVPGLNSPRSFHDQGLTNHNEQRYQLQLAFTDRVIGRLLRQLHRTRLLDRALLVVTADHGYSWEVGSRVKDRRRVTSSNVDEVAPVPLFIKAPGQRRGRIDRSYVRTIDVVPTMADVLNTRIDWPHDGRPARSRAIRGRRVVRLPTRDFSRIIRIGARRLEARRRANIRRRVRLFGTGTQSLLLFGSPYAGLYRIGPHRELLGRRLVELRVMGPGGVRARIANATLTRSVKLSSGLVPTQVAGRLTGGRRGAKRDIAVSVNGVVHAAGRSFYLRGSRAETFSLLLPETALRPGRNDLRLFEVARGTRSPRLTLLGRN